MPLSLKDRFLGCLLGQAAGDATGAPYEGLPADAIHRDFGSASKLVAAPPVDELFFTDDTHMTMGVAECLIEHGCIGPLKLIRIFAVNYDPKRGYGQGARRIFEAMQ